MGKAPEELKTAEEFWNPAMKRAVKALSDRRFVRDMEEITWMRMEGQFFLFHVEKELPLRGFRLSRLSGGIRSGGLPVPALL